jgi:hypothetical protein
MKNPLKQLIKLYNSIRYYRKNKQFDGFDKRLQAAIIKEQRDLEVNQIILKHQIVDYMRKFQKVDARSKFIPWDHKSKELCRFQVDLVFGKEMELYKVGLKEDMTLCIL